jgi:hypothetical protein
MVLIAREEAKPWRELARETGKNHIKNQPGKGKKCLRSFKKPVPSMMPLEVVPSLQLNLKYFWSNMAGGPRADWREPYWRGGRRSATSEAMTQVNLSQDPKNATNS